MDFTGRHVVLTGASSGIGRATAVRIARLGGTVTLIARRAELLEEACREIGERADFIVADVGDKEQILEAMDAAVATGGPIDGLFLNAGSEVRADARLLGRGIRAGHARQTSHVTAESLAVDGGLLGTWMIEV